MTPPPAAGVAYQVWSPMQTSMSDHVAFLSPTPSSITMDGQESKSHIANVWLSSFLFKIT